ncbi:MAG: hypothetical protein COB46_01675 [Rhodospirillaceae bacterium]|nr:MAG: hypothetical protein COB46_01675 [Rhodospirillaceae bacterium]
MSMLLAPNQLRQMMALYNINTAALFDGSTGYLSWLPSTAGNRKTWTFSAWVCKYDQGVGERMLLSGYGSSTSRHQFSYLNTDDFRHRFYNGGELDTVTTSAKYRDTTAFQHVVIVYDTTETTASDRYKLYINNEQVTSFSVANYPDLNFDGEVGNSVLQTIAKDGSGAYAYGTFYLAKAEFIDGQALTPSNFGRFDAKTDNWIAKKFNGTYGTNGFHLKFSDNSLGLEGAAFDTALGAGMTYSNGDLTATTTSPRQHLSAVDDLPTVSVTRWEVTVDAVRAGYTLFGVQTAAATITSSPAYSYPADVWGFNDNAQTSENGVLGVQSYAHPTDRTTWVLEFDADKGTLSYFAGDEYVSQITGLTGTYKPYFGIQTPVTASVIFNTADQKYNSSVQLGYDASGNSNDWDLAKYGVVKGVTNTPTHTAATLNPLDKGAAILLSNGNRTLSANSANWDAVACSMAMNADDTDGWYCEAVYTGTAGSLTFGIINDETAARTAYVGQNTNGYGCFPSDGHIYYNSARFLTAGLTAAIGDIVQLAFKQGSFWIGVNNVWMNSGNPSAGTGAGVSSLTGKWFFAGSYYNTGGTVEFRFSESDWTYSAPTGFKALATDNLPKISSSVNDHFKTVLYTGDGVTIGSGGQSVTGVGFQPDFVWIKSRTINGYAGNHELFDAIRGTTKWLNSDRTIAETVDNESLTSFDSDGFTLGSFQQANRLGDEYVAWCASLPNAVTSGWAGSPSITPSKEIYNDKLGMSIIAYTGNGTAGATIPHSLGTKPGMMIVKRLDADMEWPVYHVSLGATKNLEFNSAASAYTYLNRWNNTEPTSTVFSVGDGSNVNALGGTYVAYIFAESEFISIGSYLSNNNTDGPFVNTGTSPVWSLFKGNFNDHWIIQDKVRDPYNPTSKHIYANTDNVESDTGTDVDFVANGIKVRVGGNTPNYLTYEYFYMFIGQPNGPVANPGR